MRMHEMLCAMTGNEPTVREMGLLESALYSVEQTFMGEPLYKTEVERGARLCFCLIKNHAFVDANKRIGVLSMLVYFKLVGVPVAFTNDDIVRIGLGVASGEMDYEAHLSYLKEARTA
jgi:death-on-curing protein